MDMEVGYQSSFTVLKYKNKITAKEIENTKTSFKKAILVKIDNIE